jgi:hypothetical protein
MWIRETPDGLEVNVSAAMAEIDQLGGRHKKKLKEMRKNKLEESQDYSLVLKIDDRYFKLVGVEEAPSMKDLLKDDYDKRFEEENHKIAAELESVVEEYKQYASKILKQGEDEINKLKLKLSTSVIMPEITYAHAKAGLSLAKGEGGRTLWLYHTVYAPQYYGEEPINPVLVRKMVTPIIILITTRDDDILSVETRTLGLEYFRHYHRSGSERSRHVGSDCWGGWAHPKKFTTTDDILKCAKEAANVLVTINPNSLASRSPKGLPRESTIQQNLMRSKTAGEIPLSKTQERAGMEQVITARGGWTAR